jgi:hypothetical protein
MKDNGLPGNYLEKFRITLPLRHEGVSHLEAENENEQEWPVSALCGIEIDEGVARSGFDQHHHEAFLYAPLDSVMADFICKRCALAYRKRHKRHFQKKLGVES